MRLFLTLVVLAFLAGCAGPVPIPDHGGVITSGHDGNVVNPDKPDKDTSCKDRHNRHHHHKHWRHK